MREILRLISKSMLLLLLALALLPAKAEVSVDYSITHYTTRHGLLSNKNIKVCRDGKGYYWMGSEKGLQRFDGYSFRSFPIKGGDSLPQNFVVYQMRAVADSLLLAATSIGLLHYSYRTDQLLISPLKLDNVYCSARQVYPLNDSVLLVGYANNMGLYLYNVATQKLSPLAGAVGDAFRTISVYIIVDGPDNTTLVADRGNYFQYNHRNGTLRKFDRSAVPSCTKMFHSLKDKKGNLWYMTEEGVFVLPYKQSKIRRITSLDAYCSPKLQQCRDIMLRNDSTVFACVDWQGVFVINCNTFAVESVIRKSRFQFSELSTNSFGSIYCAEQNVLWLSGDGLYLLQPLAKGAEFYAMNEINDEVPSKILSLFQDSYGSLWVGTDGSGLHRFDINKHEFTSFFKTNTSGNTPASNVILSMLEDKALQRLWIGTYYAGLCWYDYRTKRFGNSPMDEQTGIMSNNVWTMAHDVDGNLLTSFHCRSLACRNARTGTWQNATVDNGGITCDCIVRLLTDSQGRTWIGYSGCGIDLFDTKRFAATKTVVRTPENVEAIVEDGRSLWVGTMSGLRLFDKESKQYLASSLCQQLGEQKVNALLIDSKNRLWIAAENKIYVSNPQKTALVVSSLSKYFDGSEIMAIIETRDGKLIVGGQAGLLLVPIDNAVELQNTNFSIHISEIRLFKEPVTLSDIDAPSSYDSLQSITLPYYQNYLGFSFSALQVPLNAALAYSCQLEGLDAQWFTLDEGSNRVEYSNLQPGNYVLKIKACLKDDPRVFQIRQLHITIDPPLWKNMWIRIILTVLLVAFLTLTYLARIRRLQRRQDELERAVEQRTRDLRERNAEIAAQTETLEDQYLSLKEKQKELELSNDELQRVNATKNKLFSIVAHDLKSPFSGLYGLTKMMLDDFDRFPKEKIHKLLESSFDSIVSIQALLDNLLQWSRSQSANIALHPSVLDVQQLIEETCRPLEISCKNKNISLLIDTQPNVSIIADKNTLSIVLRNLVQNAVKFTPSRGMISVTSSIADAKLRIDVRDSGEGISQQAIQQLLTNQRLDSKNGTDGETGTSLGLSVCIEFMQRNGGELLIESQPGNGSCISIVLPCKQTPETIVEPTPAETPSLSQSPSDYTILNDKIILIVDDNAAIRQHLRSVLSPHCTVLEATNGQEGIEMAQEQLPDLIVCDVVMPLMDGFALCQWVSSNQATCHIPVFLLTAKTMHIARIEGLQKGAADYITKPFNEPELLLKLANTLQHRANLQQHLRNLLQSPQAIEPSQPIDPMLLKMHQIIEQQYADSQFNAETIYEQLAMSRMTFYRKLKTLTNTMPNEMINAYRLTKAKELLSHRQFTVSEIAYQVGFNDPKYFSRKFKEFFGVPPSEVE